MSQPTCVVIGGGISGLVAASTLQNGGWKVTVLDKGYKVGGRLATRRLGEPGGPRAVFDYGAQYFTARDRRFVSLVEGWRDAGVVAQWGSGYPTMTDAFLDTGEMRYRGVPSIRAIAEHLATTLQVHTRTRVRQITRKRDSWEVQDSDGSVHAASALILTPPVPQSLELIDESGLELPAVSRQRLEAVSYSPAIAVLARLDGPSGIRLPGGLWGDGMPVSWIGDNTMKGVSPDVHAVTILTSPDFAREHWEKEDGDIAATVLRASTKWVRAATVESYVHRWKYSLVERSYGARFASIPSDVPLMFAGDAFGGGRIEGAVLSGLEVAEELLGIRS